MEEFKRFVNSFSKDKHEPIQEIKSQPIIDEPLYCPLCLKENAFPDSSRNCIHCKREVPAAYIKEIHDAKPLWIHTVGFTGHGKTVYLSLLLNILEKIPYIWSGASFRPLNDNALENIQMCRERIEDGEMPIKTPESDFPIPVLMHLKNMKRWPNKCLIMHDIAGESYQSIVKASEEGRFIALAPTSLFIISLADIFSNKSQKISDIFDVYLSALERMDASVAGRNVVVVFSKADVLIDLPEKISDYLTADDIWTDLSKLKRRDLNEKDMATYIEDMTYISNRIQEFTEGNIPSGLNLINSAETNGINLRFCVTSALGSSPDRQNTMTVPVYPKRVLDPFYWIMELDKMKNPGSFENRTEPPNIREI